RPSSDLVPLGAASSLPFLTHSFLPDVRYLLAAAVLLVFRRTWVAFTPLDKQRGIPLVLAFLLVGMFVWFAENIATFLGAWQYPHQARSEEHTSELQSRENLVCRLLLEKKKKEISTNHRNTR